jgi:mannitol-1-phosphate 5-dehydrogenase
MLQSAAVLVKCYPDDFSLKDLELHTDDLIARFRNKALKDTVFRVGQDLTRKLGDGDRFMGAVRMAKENEMPCDSIIKAMSYGFFFRATDEEGRATPSDIEFLEQLKADFEQTMTGVLHLHPETDKSLIETLKTYYY